MLIKSQIATLITHKARTIYRTGAGGFCCHPYYTWQKPSLFYAFYRLMIKIAMLLKRSLSNIAILKMYYCAHVWIGGGIVDNPYVSLSLDIQYTMALLLFIKRGTAQFMRLRPLNKKVFKVQNNRQCFLFFGKNHGKSSNYCRFKSNNRNIFSRIVCNCP